MTGDDGGLSRLLDTLDTAGVTYFVDSGVLLGLRRNGHLNPWEKDIDLGVLWRDLRRLLAATDDIAAAGYQVDVQRYRGTVFSVGMKPAAEVGLRAAAHIFYAIGDHLVSPQTQMYVPPPAPDVLPHAPGWIGRALRRVGGRYLYRPETADGRASRAPDTASWLHRTAGAAYRRVDRGLLAETWPVSEVYVPMTWVIPRRLIEPITTREFGGVAVPVPAQVDDYLAYRYGDWQTPVRDWCYWEDDGALRRRPPGVVARELAATASGTRPIGPRATGNLPPDAEP